MDLSWDAESEVFRERIRTFLTDNLPAGFLGVGALDTDEYHAFMATWRSALARAGLLAISWPLEYGGAGLSPLDQVVLAEEFARAGVPTEVPSDVFSITMLGNVLLRHGSPEQRRELLPRILSGEDRWCQGFSEPGAGSDLAGLQCRADLVDGQWVLNGQKIWASHAHVANHVFVLARTDRSAARHAGITLLLVDMHQPGVEVRGIRMLSGGSEFNELFFRDAKTAPGNVVGAVNGGWKVAMSLLGYERGAGAAAFSVHFQAELERLGRLAERTGQLADPIVRDRLAEFHTRCQIMRLLGLRALTRQADHQDPGPLAGLTKIQWTEYHQDLTQFALDLLGPDALVASGRWPVRFAQGDDPGAAGEPSSWIASYLNARAGSIYGGTNEIQRNVIAERVLGLPREAAPTPAAR